MLTATAAAQVRRADALALTIGSKVTVSTLMLACVLTIVIGAAGMLDALRKMDADLKLMSQELAISNEGTVVLNSTMDSLGPTATSLENIVGTVGGTSREVKLSGKMIGDLGTKTTTLNSMLGGIASDTSSMRGSLEEVDAATGRLGDTVNDLNTKIGPLAKTQHSMLGETRRMQVGMGGMNASLAYVIRTLNYISAPPTGQGFTVKADLDKKSLPPIPGVHVKTEPIEVYPRNAWPLYTGP